MRKLLLMSIIAVLGLPPVSTASTSQSPIEDYVDGITTSLPKIVHARPRRIEGTLTVGRHKMDFASGGTNWSIPYGDFPVTPESVGSWGSRHGAIGLNDGTIYDKQLGRDRDGIEIHASGHMASAGCVVVSHSDFGALKKEVTALIATFGRAFLHIGPDGASITPEKRSPLQPFIYLAENKSPEHTIEHVVNSKHYHKQHRHADRERNHRHYIHHHYRRYAAS